MLLLRMADEAVLNPFKTMDADVSYTVPKMWQSRSKFLVRCLRNSKLTRLCDFSNQWLESESAGGMYDESNQRLCSLCPRSTVEHGQKKQISLDLLIVFI